MSRPLPRARDLNEQLRQTVTVARSIAHGLAPVSLERNGLSRGLEELAEGSSPTGVHVLFSLDHAD